MNEKRKRNEELTRLKESLAADLMAQSDSEVLQEAATDGIDADTARSQVLDAFRKAKVLEQRPAGTRNYLSSSGKKPTVLAINAARARNILRRVAQRPHVQAPAPLLQAAQLEAKKDDAEVLEVVAELRNLGVVSDDELK
jgi:hypothetical protein